MKKLLLIINPVTAKPTISPHLIDVIDIFENGGYDVTVHISKHKNDIKELLGTVGESFDVVVSAGGDGTLNETVSGILPLNKKPRIGYIPSGTTNDFAKSWGIPSNPITVAKNIITEEPIRADICLFCNRPFVYVAAFGAFTEVSYQTPQQLKQNLGRTAYLLEGIKSLPTIKPWKLHLEYDDGEIDGEFLYGMLSNTKRVGGFDLKVKDAISICDGLMELILVRNPNKPVDNAKMLSAVLTQDTKSEYITFVQAKNITFRTDIPMPWTVDGEPGGSLTEGKVEIIEHAVELYI